MLKEVDRENDIRAKNSRERGLMAEMKTYSDNEMEYLNGILKNDNHKLLDKITIEDMPIVRERKWVSKQEAKKIFPGNEERLTGERIDEA